MRRLLTLAMAACAVLLLTAGWATAAPPRPTLVTDFSAGDYGSFAEGMAADSHGKLYVALTVWGLYDDTVDPVVAESNIGQIWKVTPHGVKTLMATKDLSPNGMLLGVAVRRDRVYVALYDMGSGTIGNGVYRLGTGGALTQVVSLPEGVWPNGIAFHGRRLYITDSATGAVWRARLGGDMAAPAKPWLKNSKLAPGDPATDPTLSGIGANGIAFRGDDLYVGVADGARIMRVHVRKNGAHGRLRTVCHDLKLLSADGIAFDAPGGLWITTNHGTTAASPSGGLYRLTPKGVLRTKANDPSWLDYPTTPVFGTTRSTNRTLFIENGAYYDFNMDGTHPDIRSLRVGVPGLPL
jgi:sugar lactone lactonase YvrE